MKSLTVFPFTPDVEVMLRRQAMLRDVAIDTVLTFAESVAAAKRRVSAPVTISSDIVCLSATDALLLMDSEKEVLPVKYRTCADFALKNNVEILCGKALAQALALTPGQYTPMEHVFPATGLYGEPLRDIPAPVIGVMGMGPHCSKLETMLCLQREIELAGYRPVSVGANTAGSLFGMAALLDFVFASGLSFSDKVLKCNRYLYELCQAEKPDALILELPGGIMPFGRYGYNHFSELPLLLSSAAPIDIGILNVYFDHPMDRATQENLSGYCKFKYNAPLYGFCRARQAIALGENRRKYDFYHLDDAYIERHRAGNRQTLYPVLEISDEESMRTGIKGMIRRLEGNAAAV